VTSAGSPRRFVVSLAFGVCVVQGKRRLAGIALPVSLGLLLYPFFTGLTDEGRTRLWVGSLAGLAALLTMQSGVSPRRVT
jgi:hypothetical protein